MTRKSQKTELNLSFCFHFLFFSVLAPISTPQNMKYMFKYWKLNNFPFNMLLSAAKWMLRSLISDSSLLFPSRISETSSSSKRNNICSTIDHRNYAHIASLCYVYFSLYTLGCTFRRIYSSCMGQMLWY